MDCFFIVSIILSPSSDKEKIIFRLSVVPILRIIQPFSSTDIIILDTRELERPIYSAISLA